MNSMNDQHCFDLAMKVIAGHASDAERAELDGLIANEPRFKAEFERLQSDVRTAKETVGLVDATTTTEGTLPAYARGRLQTKVRQTLGRSQEAQVLEQDQKMMWKWWWILGLASGVAAVVFLVFPAITRPDLPTIQVAMLDTVGTVRGSDDNEVVLLKQQWKSADIHNFDNPVLLKNWETNWPDGNKVVAKVIYDHTTGEVRLLLHGTGGLQQRIFTVDRDLVTTLHEVDAYVRKQMRQ